MNGYHSKPSLNVVIIGGSSGIGRSMVECFAKHGHFVYATYYSNENAAAELKEKFSNVECCFLDQGDLDSVENFSENIKKWLGTLDDQDLKDGQKVDILVNNAALGSATVVKYVQSKSSGLELWTKMSRFRQQALEDDALMKVNALGPLWVTDVVLPFLRKPNPREIPRNGASYLNPQRNYSTIVFMGSVGGSVAVFPEYRASDLMSKSAVTYLSKHLAAKYTHSHIDVFCLAPGATNTDMFRQSTLEHVIDPNGFLQQMPKGRLLEPEEVAESVYALTTESWGRIFHGGVLDASLGLGVRPGLQTESTMERT